MGKVVVLLVDKYSTRKQDFSELQAILAKAGVHMRVEMSDNYSHDSVMFSYDEEFVKYKQGRNAGRKPKYAKGWATVAEVKKWLETKTADEIASNFGISKSTLYRRLKRDDHDFI